PFTWQIVVAGGTAPAFDATITDALPPDWSYVPGTTTITTPYGTSTTDPTCAATCTWTGLVSGPGQPLAPGQTITIQFAATPGPSLATPSTTGPVDHLETATVTVHDASGSAG